MMKEMLTFTLCSMMTFSPLVGGTSTQLVNNQPAMGSQTEIANPFVEYETLEAASKAAGFEMTAPNEFREYTERTIRAMKDQMIEVIYLSGKDKSQEGGQIRIRKAAGTGNISGDYSAYTDIQEVEADGLQITMKGDGEKVKSAIWTANGYTFSVSDPIGMNSSDMQELIRMVK